MVEKWRYCFSNYTTGRVGDFSGFEKASTEVRDRTVARTVPRSRMNTLSSGNDNFQLFKIKLAYFDILFVQLLADEIMLNLPKCVKYRRVS